MNYYVLGLFMFYHCARRYWVNFKIVYMPSFHGLESRRDLVQDYYINSVKFKSVFSLYVETLFILIEYQARFQTQIQIYLKKMLRFAFNSLFCLNFKTHPNSSYIIRSINFNQYFDLAHCPVASLKDQKPRYLDPDHVPILGRFAFRSLYFCALCHAFERDAEHSPSLCNLIHFNDKDQRCLYHVQIQIQVLCVKRGFIRDQVNLAWIYQDHCHTKGRQIGTDNRSIHIHDIVLKKFFVIARV